jgi:hypothetical protein
VVSVPRGTRRDVSAPSLLRVSRPLNRRPGRSGFHRFSSRRFPLICSIATCNACSALWISNSASCPLRRRTRLFRSQRDASSAVAAADLSRARLSSPGEPSIPEFRATAVQSLRLGLPA